jgi:hypothetical protein
LLRRRFFIVARQNTLVLLSALFACWTGCASRAADDSRLRGSSPNATAGTGGAAAPAEPSRPFDNSPAAIGGAGGAGGEQKLAQPAGHGSNSIAEIQGSGVHGESVRSADAFDRIDIHAFADVHVSFGAQRVVVSGDDNIVPHLITRVDGGELHIDMETNLALTYNLPLQVEVTMPTLTEVHARFSGKVSIKELNAAELTLDCYATDAAASGKVDRFTLSNDLGSVVDALLLQAKVVMVTSGSGGTTLLTASEEIDGTLVGGAELHVFGNPALRNVTASSGAMISYE